MNEDKRYYRKNLSSQGLLYLSGEELDMEIKNISVTGMLIKIKNPPEGRTLDELFENISQQPVLDVFIAKMALACEVTVVRADIDETEISLAVEFRKVSARPDNALYKRQFYRKNMEGSGFIVLNGKIYPVESINASKGGLMVQVIEPVEAKPGRMVVFRYDGLEFNGDVYVVWVSSQSDGSAILGLQFVDDEESET